MKLVASIRQLEEVYKLKKYVSYVMVEEELIEESSILTILSEGLTPILKLNRMLHPFEIHHLNEKMKKDSFKKCLFYITDLGLAHIFKKMGFLGQVIYDPITMITNHLDAKEYYDYGFLAIGLSNEVPLADVNSIANYSKAKCFYQIFGYRLMFHSRRKLISLYLDKINQKKEGKSLTLKEATRTEEYPIVENEQGTYIYRSYVISLLKHLQTLKIEYAFLDSIHLDFNLYLEVVKLYYEVLNGLDVHTAWQRYTLLNLKTSDGFSYRDTVYNKEEF